jgi:hypothetical protein
MLRLIQLAVAFLLIAVIVYIVISPVVDLPGTVLRGHGPAVDAGLHIANILPSWAPMGSGCQRGNIFRTWYHRGILSRDLTNRISALLC